MNLSNLTITQELLKIIAELDAFNASWEVKSNHNPEYLTHLRHVATIESIGSSTRIEGVKLTDSEIESLLGKVGQQSFSSRDEQEVIGYASVMDTVFNNFQDIQISENYIKQLHRDLLRLSEKVQRHMGEYKKHSNNVEAFDQFGKSLGVVFETTSAFDTPAHMQELVYWTRESLADKSYHPLIVISVFNVVFLAIHPFQDGNGRLSRILVTLLMLKAGYNYIPYSSLESIIEKRISALNMLPKCSKELDKMAKGNVADFNLTTNRRDEMGQFVNDINKMHQSFHVIIKETSGTSNQLVVTLEQLSSIALQTKSHMHDQEDQVLQIASAIDQMNTSGSEISANAEAAAKSAEETNLLASQGEKSVLDTQNTITNLLTEVENASNVIYQLRQDSDNIGSILEVIRGIAEQTNLLALNAAIEAARAGEQGRGFAVVADEVRTLAGRTQESTEEINELISRLQTSSKKATETMDNSKSIAQQGSEHINQTSQFINKINSEMDVVEQVNHAIATAAKEQNNVINDVSQSINRISRVASDTVLSSFELVEVNASLGLQAKKLQSILAIFNC